MLIVSKDQLHNYFKDKILNIIDIRVENNKKII